MNDNQDCVAYAGHLQAEHRHLHHRLRDLQVELNNVNVDRIDGPMLQRMIEGGQQLTDELTSHFAEEQAGGCMDYAVSRVPALGAEVTSLEAEHPVLLRDLNSMLTQLRNARAGELGFAEIKQQFDAFVVRLLSHEARESRVVERGFNMPLDE